MEFSLLYTWCKQLKKERKKERKKGTNEQQTKDGQTDGRTDILTSFFQLLSDTWLNKVSYLKYMYLILSYGRTEGIEGMDRWTDLLPRLVTTLWIMSQLFSNYWFINLPDMLQLMPLLEVRHQEHSGTHDTQTLQELCLRYNHTVYNKNKMINLLAVLNTKTDTCVNSTIFVYVHNILGAEQVSSI